MGRVSRHLYVQQKERYLGAGGVRKHCGAQLIAWRVAVAVLSLSDTEKAGAF